MGLEALPYEGKKLNSDAMNYESSDGDVLPVTFAEFSDAPSKERMLPDHLYGGGSAEIQFIAPPEQKKPESLGEDQGDNVEQLSPADRQERLMALKHKFGFYPQNNQEFNRMIAVLANSDSRYPALNHLDHVYNRQRRLFTKKELANASMHDAVLPSKSEADKKLTPHEEGVRTMRSIVREFTEYAKETAPLGFFASELKKHIERQEPHNFTAFKNISDINFLMEDPGSIRAMMATAKLVEIRDYVVGSGDDPLHKRKIINNDKNKTSRILDKLGNLRVTELLRNINSVVAEQRARRNFWIDRLHESTRHTYVRAQAYGALRDLGGL